MRSILRKLYIVSTYAKKFGRCKAHIAFWTAAAGITSGYVFHPLNCGGPALWGADR